MATPEIAVRIISTTLQTADLYISLAKPQVSYLNAIHHSPIHILTSASRCELCRTASIPYRRLISITASGKTHFNHNTQLNTLVTTCQFMAYRVPLSQICNSPSTKKCKIFIANNYYRHSRSAVGKCNYVCY
jgi:hypothetical protein